MLFLIIINQHHNVNIMHVFITVRVIISHFYVIIVSLLLVIVLKSRNKTIKNHFCE